jgi:hypothetical protein
VTFGRILQPFEQLGRQVYVMTDEESRPRRLTRFAGMTVKGGAILGLVANDFSRGSAQDNGYVYEIHGAMGADRLTVKLSPGIVFGAGAQQDQKVVDVQIEGNGERVEADAVAVSEAIRTLERLRSG